MSMLQFLVLIDDKPGAIGKRIEFREQHLSNVEKLQAIHVGGTFNPYGPLMIGPLFAKEPTLEDPNPFKVWHYVYLYLFIPGNCHHYRGRVTTSNYRSA